MGSEEEVDSIAKKIGRTVGAAPATQTVPKIEAVPALSVCYASTADETYMGYANRDELLAFLKCRAEMERYGVL